jgi:hypothetical protein
VGLTSGGPQGFPAEVIAYLCSDAARRISSTVLRMR